MTYLFAFDRDFTIDSSDDPGPIPIGLVRWLAHETPHEVWAIGNQKLKAEAAIQGIDELKSRLGLPAKRIGDAKDTRPIADKRIRNINGKHKRLRMLYQAFPSQTRYLVVDDFSEVGEIGLPWSFYLPHQFMVIWPKLKADIMRMME